jgi:hypothetical protein
VGATVAVAVGGCGDDAATQDVDGGSARRTQDERLATQRVREFLAAMEQRDDARACATMTPDLQRGINRREASTCRRQAVPSHGFAELALCLGARRRRGEVSVGQAEEGATGR